MIGEAAIIAGTVSALFMPYWEARASAEEAKVRLAHSRLRADFKCGSILGYRIVAGDVTESARVSHGWDGLKNEAVRPDFNPYRLNARCALGDLFGSNT